MSGIGRRMGGGVAGGGGGGAPTGPAGGSLGGTYPNPTVVQIDGTAGSAAVIAGTSLVAAAGAGGIDFHSATGAWQMPTGAGSWAGASGKALSLVATAAAITITSAASCTWSSANVLTLNGGSGMNLQAAGATLADVGVTTGSTVTLAAGVSLAGAAGAGGLSFGAMTGATALPTGVLGWSGAAGQGGTLTSGATFGLDAATSISLGAGSATQVTIGNTANTASFALRVAAGSSFAFQVNSIVPTFSIAAQSATWGAATGAVTYGQTIQVANTPPTSTTVAAQSANTASTTGTAANTTGATLLLQGGLGSNGNGGVWQAGDVQAIVGAPSAGGTEAYFKTIRTNATGGSPVTLVQMGCVPGSVADGTIYLSALTPSTANFALRGASGGATVSLNAVTTVQLQIGGANQLALTSAALTWASGLGAVTMGHTAAASTSSTNGAVGGSTTLVAQAGQAATGAAHNGGNGGNLVLGAGAGGTSGSATAGLGGTISLGSGLAVQQIAVSSSTYTVDSNSVTSDLVILTSRSSTGTGTITLPAVAAGRLVWIKDTGTANTNNQTISPASGTIDGAASYVLNLAKACVLLMSDGSNWFVIAEYNGTVI